jgi:CheY-specific phosphatase CheX
MTSLQKDVLNGLAFITGIIGFMSGEFIISSALFAATAVASNVNMNRKNQLN